MQVKLSGPPASPSTRASSAFSYSNSPTIAVGAATTTCRATSTMWAAAQSWPPARRATDDRIIDNLKW